VDERNPEKTEYRLISKTEVIYNHQNVTWVPITLESRVCTFHAKIQIFVFDHNDFCKHRLIGQTAVTSLHELRMSDASFPLIHPSRKGNIGYFNSGILKIRDFKPVFEKTPEAKSYKFKFTAEALRQKDALSKSDPYFSIHAYPISQCSVIHGRPNQRTPPTTTQFFTPIDLLFPPTVDTSAFIPPNYSPKIFESEILYDNRDPEWSEFELNVDECGGMLNNIEIRVYDFDRNGKHDLVGKFVTNLIELTLPTADFKLKSPHHKFKQGILHVKEFNPIPVPTPLLSFARGYSVKFKAIRLERKDGGITLAQRNSDPFLKFFTIRPNVSDEFVQAGQTSVLKGTDHPEWDPFVISSDWIQSLDSPIKIECWDKDTSSDDDFIGIAMLSIREMKVIQQRETGVQIINEANKHKIGYKNSGILEISAIHPFN
jgi:Ca2+-dependent lipid-binding protein